ncbi:FkbM family methyltransferase [Nocardia sp. NPDC049149]|uniref:FkbM family methyltransferase n=1 Tax=Nocardia sp. NPDC049149 TaxID=3364315 RepID=UPI00371FB305
MTVPMIPTLINGRWELLLPEHRAARPEWPVWEQERLAHMHDHIEEGTVVFDIGSEEGDFPALFTSWGADVVLFEPNWRVWPNIRVIWEANGLKGPRGFFVGFSSNATVLRPTQVEPIFLEPDRDGWPACAYGPVIGDHGFRNVSERFHDTPQTRLDDYRTRTGIRPDVVTLDVEGAELEVLKGAEGTLTEVRPLVYVSVHPAFMAAMFPYTVSALHDYMNGLDYRGEHLVTDHEEHWIFTPQ